jgi:hypothetical protein
MALSRMLTLKFGGQENNAWPYIPAIIICRVNNRISKTLTFVAEILSIMLKGLHWGFLTWWDWKYFFQINVPFDEGLNH